MPKGYALENVSEDAGQRLELEAFLRTFTEVRGDAIPWLERFRHWWDVNPAGTQDLPRGWVLRHGSEVVGFAGVIVFDYLLRGVLHKVPALTTWMVAQGHRAQSMKLFHKYYALRNDRILLNTAANRDVQRVLEVMKFSCAPELSSFIFFVRQHTPSLAGLAAGLGRLFANGALRGPAPARLIDAQGLAGMQGDLTPDDGRLRKRISLEYLRWFCNCPTPYEKEFIGALDGNGELSAYIICLKYRYRGRHPYLSVIEHYARERVADVLGLLRLVCEEPRRTRLAGDCLFVALNSFSPGELFPAGGLPRIRRTSFFPHYYHLPASLAGAGKHCQLAEGDVGC